MEPPGDPDDPAQDRDGTVAETSLQLLSVNGRGRTGKDLHSLKNAGPGPWPTPVQTALKPCCSADFCSLQQQTQQVSSHIYTPTRGNALEHLLPNPP